MRALNIKSIRYSFSKTMDTKLTIDAVTKAFKKQTPENELIIHSDRRTQYIVKLFIDKEKTRLYTVI